MDDIEEKEKELLEQFLIELEETQTKKKYCSAKDRVRKRLTPEQIRRIDDMRQY